MQKKKNLSKPWQASAISTSYSFLGTKGIHVLWTGNVSEWLGFYVQARNHLQKEKVDAMCDNKVFKATDGGHELTKRILRGRAS